MIDDHFNESIKAQLDALEKISFGAAGLILVLIWSALQNQSEFAIFGIPARRDNVYTVAGLSLSAIYLTASLYFVRLQNLIHQVAASGSAQAFFVITRHPWLMSPFAGFLENQKLSWSDGASRASMPFLWTLGCGALWTISIPYETYFLASIMLIHVGCGLLMTWQVLRALTAVDGLTEVNDKIPATNMRKQGIILSVLGIGAATVADKLLDVMYFYYSR